MEKQLVWQDEHANKQHRQKWEKERADVQKVVDLYNACKLPAMKDGNDLYRMVNDTTDFMFDMLCGGEAAHLTIGTGENRTHLPIVKSKAIDMLEKPAGYNELMAGIGELVITAKNGQTSSGDITWNIVSIAKFFTISDGVTVNFTEKKAQEIEDFGNRYVSSEEAKKVHAFVADTLKKYHELGIGSKVGYMEKFVDPYKGNFINVLMNVIHRYNEETGKWEPGNELFAFDRHMMAAENR